MNQNVKFALSKERVLCEACYCILMKPVTFPCSHSFCFDCLKNTFKENALNCPKCRQRIGGWFRKATMKGKEPIDEPFWTQIQSQFPDELKRRLNGEDDGIYRSIMNQERPAAVQISKPGEVYNEFESLRRKHVEEVRLRNQKEELANEKYAKQLQKEEEERAAAERLRREMEDLEVAKKLQEEMGDPALTERHQPDSPLVPGGFAISTPKQKQGSSKSNKNGYKRRGLLSDTSTVSSYGEKSTVVIGPLDSFVRPKDKNASSSRSEIHSQLSFSTILTEKSSEFQLSSDEISYFKKTPPDPRNYWKIAYTSSDASPKGHVKEEDNQFRPIRPSPLTPTKNNPASQVFSPQTMKPSSSKSLFSRSVSDSAALKPIPSNAPFSSGRCAFAPTSAANRGTTSVDNSDSETDFEDSLGEIESSPNAALTPPQSSEITATSIAEMKELEDCVVRSYSNQIEESADSALVNSNKKSYNQLQSSQSNKFSFSPESKERYRQIMADYELARQLQEKENLANKQPVESNYELRKRPPQSGVSAGNASKKRRLDNKSGKLVKTKQRTIEEAFQLKSS